MTPNALSLKQPNGRELLGGDLLAQSLHALGVEVAFGLHGGHLDAFLMGCTDIGIELIDTRHETVAVQAAEGYAKVSGKTGCCFVTANSGFCNGLPGLSTAFADRSPILCVTSSPPLRDAETNALQGFHDQVVLSKPITKFCHRITNVGEIPRLVSLAWRIASSGTPGPCLLDFPIDVLFTPVSSQSVSWGGVTAPPVAVPGPDVMAVRDAVAMIKESSRPAIIVGTGARDAVNEISKFAEATGIPIFHSPKYSTQISFSHPFHAGSATTLPLLGLKKKSPPDLIMLLGARTGFLLGGRGGAIIPNSGCKLIQVDIDGGEIGRSEHVDLGIVSDTFLTVSALNEEFAKQQEASNYRAPEQWIRDTLSLKSWRAPHNESESILDSKNGHLHPYHAVKKLLQCIPNDSIVCIDGGEAGGWALQCLPDAHASLSMVCTGYLGFLGNGWGYSLGAAVADPSKLVVNLHGDGSAGFHIGELDTFAKFGLRILTVVVNNSVWGMSQAGQEMIYGSITDKRPAAKLKEGTRYDLVAEGFGCTGIIVDATGERFDLSGRRRSFMDLGPGEDTRSAKVLEGIGAAVDEIVHGKGPGLIDLRVSPYPFHDTTKAMVGATEDPNVIVVPYYDNLPRPYYKGQEAKAASEEEDRVDEVMGP